MRGDTIEVLDLYAREGGAGEGFAQADPRVRVTGVDIKDTRRRNPHPLIVADVTRLDPRWIARFDYVHASPPCQFGTALRHAPNAKGEAGHVNLIPATRRLLNAAGVPYSIENVADVAKAGHLGDSPVMLNGYMFGLGCTTSAGVRFHLDRERWFETNWGFVQPWAPPPLKPVCGIYGAHIRNRSAAHGGRTTVDFPGEDRPALAQQAMGMPWATLDGMSEAIPPAFSRFMLEQFLILKGLIK